MKHLITPPTELVGEWLCSEDYSWGPLEQASITITTNRLQNVATQAAQWGADQELEACKQFMHDQDWFMSPTLRMAQLHNARRPKPPSLKEQALDALREAESTGCLYVNGRGDTIRRALEALDE